MTCLGPLLIEAVYFWIFLLSSWLFPLHRRLKFLCCCWCVNVFAGVAFEQALLLGSREKSREYRTRKNWRHECEGWRKLLFLRPSRLRHSLATRNGELVRRLLQYFQFSTKLLVFDGSFTLGSPNLSIAMFLFSHFARLKNGEIITTCHT